MCYSIRRNARCDIYLLLPLPQYYFGYRVYYHLNLALYFFVTKYVTKVELKWLYHTCQKRVLEFQNEDPSLYADATKEVKSTFHHCVVRLNQRFYSAFFEKKNGNLLDKKLDMVCLATTFYLGQL